MDSKPLVIYHAGCYDGFASAFVAWLYFGEGNVDFYPASYGTEPPWDMIMCAKDIYIIDFSYKHSVMTQIHNKMVGHLTILDHHKTAEAELAPFKEYVKCINCHVEFDMNRSGAGMAWDYFFRNKSKPASLNVFYERSVYTEDGYPWLIAYIQDRDLWKFKLEDSKQVNAYISTLKLENFELWQDELLEMNPINAAEIGEIILRKIESYNEEMMKAYMFENNWTLPDGEVIADVPILNAPHIGVSELLNYVLEKTGSLLAVGFKYNNKGIWTYSIRGTGQIDVSEIAAQYNGGGHHNASGFELDHLIFKLKK